MTSETIAEIVAEMRELAADIEAGNAVVGQTVWRNYADRIEAAAKRLREDEYHRGAEAREKFIYAVLGKPSNAAAMREALEYADSQLRAATEDNTYGDDVVYLVGCMRAVASACRAALSAPPRNCDVGTAEEQSVRMLRFCYGCGGCAVCKRGKGMSFRECVLAWAQEPYKEGGAK